MNQHKKQFSLSKHTLLEEVNKIEEVNQITKNKNPIDEIQIQKLLDIYVINSPRKELFVNETNSEQFSLYCINRLAKAIKLQSEPDQTPEKIKEYFQSLDEVVYPFYNLYIDIEDKILELDTNNNAELAKWIEILVKNFKKRFYLWGYDNKYDGYIDLLMEKKNGSMSNMSIQVNYSYGC